MPKDELISHYFIHLEITPLSDESQEKIAPMLHKIKMFQMLLRI